MNTENSFILFYSNYCKHCKDFLVKLSNLDPNLFNNFKKICVDNNQNIPSSITSVPTIITPTHNHPLTDNAVFIWLDTMAGQYISTESQNSQNVEQTEVRSENKEEISPFIANEMGGQFSDNFSFLDGDPMAGPLVHNFSFLTHDNKDQTNNSITNSDHNAYSESNRNHEISNRGLTQLDFQLERPEMSERGYTGFEKEFDSLKNDRDNDPYIRHAPQRR